MNANISPQPKDQSLVSVEERNLSLFGPHISQNIQIPTEDTPAVAAAMEEVLVLEQSSIKSKSGACNVPFAYWFQKQCGQQASHAWLTTKTVDDLLNVMFQ